MLVLLGLYFLGAQLRIPLPGFDQLWPGLIVLGGLLMLAGYAFSDRRGSGSVFAGVLLTLTGIFFFFFTLHLRVPAPPLQDGVDWPDMGRLWPIFVLNAGVAFLAQWLAQPDNRGARNVSLLALLVGLIALAVNFSINDESLIRRIVQWWPLLLVAAGLQMLFGYFRKGRGSSQ